MDNNEVNPISSLKGNVSKLAVPIGSTMGVLTDIFSPLAPIAPILLCFFIFIFLYFYFLKVRPKLKSQDISNKEVYSSRNAQIAGFSVVSVIILSFFWIISSQYPNEGVLAGNIDGVKKIQSQLLGTLEDVSKKQDIILNKQKDISSDIQDIKDIIIGDTEIEQLSSTEDYTVFKEINKKTDDYISKTIAVLYFDNNSNNSKLDPLRKGLADMIISDLSNLDILKVVEREKIEKVLDEINFNNSDSFDSDTQQKIGRLLGAEMILFGSYFELMNQFRIDAKIVKTETGEIIKSEGVNGITSDFMKLEKQLVWKIARELDVKLKDKEKTIFKMDETINYNAILLFSEGLELYDSGNKDDALKKIKTALEIEPNFQRAKDMIDKLTNI